MDLPLSLSAEEAGGHPGYLGTEKGEQRRSHHWGGVEVVYMAGSWGRLCRGDVGTSANPRPADL